MNRNLSRLLACCLLALSLCVSLRAEAALYGAVAVEDITPPDLNMSCMAGYDFGRPATGVHDPLTARCICLKDEGGDEFCFVVLDMVGYTSARINPIKDELALEGLPVDHLVVISTHTHGGTDGVGIWGGGCDRTGVDKFYLDIVDRKIVAAVQAARQDYQPVAIRFGTASAPGVARDSRAPRLTDDDVICLQAVAAADYNQTVFSLMNYGVHATVLGSDNTLYTGDLAYFCNYKFEDEFGGTAVWIPNSEGAVYLTEGEETYANADVQSDTLVNLAVPVIRAASFHEDLDLDVAGRRVPFQLNNQAFIAMTAGGLLELDFQELVDTNFTIPTDIAFVKLTAADGNVVASIGTGPGELFPDVGIEVRNAMPGPDRFLFNIANNQLGYLVPYYEFKYPESFLNAGGNYHETTSAGSELVPTYLPNMFELIGVPTQTPPATHTNTPAPTATPTRTPRITRTPTPMPTDTPSAEADLDVRATFTTERNVKVELRLVSPTAGVEASAYVAVEVAGNFYFAMSFSDTPQPLATFTLPAVDTGWFELLALPLGDPLPAPITLTWYSLLLNSGGNLLGGLKTSAVTIQ